MTNNEMELMIHQLKAQQELQIQLKKADMQIEILEMHRRIQEELKHQMFLDIRKNKINRIKEKINN